MAPSLLAIEGLHVLVHKSYAQADALPDTVKGGPWWLREIGKYQKTLETHVTRVWAEFRTCGRSV